MNYQGGCHCGRVAFDVDMEIGKVVQCNCSICSKKGHLLAFVTADKVTLHTAESDLSTYMFNTHRIRHQFCPVCGIAPFGRGVDSKGNETFAINVRCLDGVDPSTLEVQAFDGRSL
jgi:hypothetical protein